MKKYIADRKTKPILKYGLQRRTKAVIQQLQRLDLPESCILLDIGTADGLMLRSLIESLNSSRKIGIGIDTRFHSLRSAKENVTYAIQADGRRLPFRTGRINVIISTAVFKHIDGLQSCLTECRRVLKMGGKIVATDPTPLGIHVGILLGHFSRRSIAQALGLKATRQMLTRCDFKVLQAERFMLCPIPFAGSDAIERTLKRAHLDQLFLDQVICASAC